MFYSQNEVSTITKHFFTDFISIFFIKCFFSGLNCFCWSKKNLPILKSSDIWSDIEESDIEESDIEESDIEESEHVLYSLSLISTQVKC